MDATDSPNDDTLNGQVQKQNARLQALIEAIDQLVAASSATFGDPIVCIARRSLFLNRHGATPSRFSASLLLWRFASIDSALRKSAIASAYRL